MNEKNIQPERPIGFWLFLLGSLILIATSNKYWAPFDEGIVSVAAQLVLKGKVLYRDVFMVMYPPGQVYVVSLIYRIFGPSLEIARLFTVFVQVLIAFLVYKMSDMMSGKLRYSVLAWLFTMTCLGIRMGTIPAPIWTGMAFALLSMFLFLTHVKTGDFRKLIYAALTGGLTVLFRHDIGIFVFISIFLTLVISRYRLSALIAFIFFWMIMPLSMAVYFYSNNALNDIWNSLVTFTFTHQNTAGIPFPPPCLNPNMIFHQSLHFIKVNQYYIPILVYVFVFVYLCIIYYRDRDFDTDERMACAMLIFGILAFNQVRIRTDPAHLLTVIYPAVILFSFGMKRMNLLKGVRKFLMYPFKVYCYLIFALCVLLAIKNLDKGFKNVIKKPIRGDMVLTRFEGNGSIYVPKGEHEDIIQVIKAVRTLTSKEEYIYIGNESHDVDAFGGTLLLYTLCDRKPCTKYYEILPGLITMDRVRHEIARSLKERVVNVLVLQDIGLPKGPSGTAESGQNALDKFIHANYRMKKKIGRYYIYERKGNFYR